MHKFPEQRLVSTMPAVQMNGAGETLRKSGVETIGDLPWGAHFCQFYASQDELLEILVPYFARGLADNECCLWVTSQFLPAAEAEAALRKAVPWLQHCLAKGQFQIIDHTDWYVVNGAFDSKLVIERWLEKLQFADRCGFDGLRLSGDTFWLGKDQWRDFLAYEAEVDEVICTSRILALCTYSTRKSRGPEMLGVFANHEFALMKGEDGWEIVHNASRRRAHQALKESDARFQMLFESMAEGLALNEIVTDEAGATSGYRILDVNPAFERLTSLKRSELLGKRMPESSLGLLPDRTAVFQWVTTTGQPSRFEEYVSNLNLWFDVLVYRTAPGRFATIFTDITERKRAEANLRWSARRTELLSETASLLLQSSDPQRVIEGLCQKVMQFLDCQVFFNYLADDETGRLLLNAYAGVPKEAASAIEWLDYGVAICGCVARDQGRIVASNIQEGCDPRATLVKSYGVRAYCCHPLKAQGCLIGTLSFGSRTRASFNAAEIEVMESVSGLVAMAMHRIQIEAALRKSRTELEAEADALVKLDEAGSRLWRAHDLAEGLDEMLRVSMELLAADMGNVQILDPQRNVLVIKTHVGFGQDFLDYFREITASGESAYAKAMRNGKRIVIEDVERDPSWRSMLHIARAAGFRAVQSTPLFGREGAFLGVLSTHFRAPHRPTPNELRRLDLYARKAVDFMERLKIDEARLESEARLRAVMDALPVGVAMTDAQGGKLAGNAAFEEIWGRPLPEIKSVADYEPFKAWRVDTGEPMLPEDWASALAIRNGATVVGQLLRIQTFDGRTAYINNSAAPILDSRGQVSGSAVAILDITNEVQTLEALRKSQQDLSHAQSVGSIGSWRLDIRKNELTWSSENHRIFGLPEGTQLTYESFLDCVHPDDRADVDREWRSALDGAPYDIEHRLVVNGDVKWVREKAVLEFAPDGELLGGFGVTQDITSRKQREEQIQHLLREVNHRAKNMLALVQAIAWRTAATEPLDFVERFSQRIGALAASQDLLVQSEWSGVEVVALVRSQLAHFEDLIGSRITLDGPSLRFSAAASQSIGMALHELSTNAGKYGALSDENGEVAVAWNIERRDRAPRFILSWMERNGPPVAPSSRHGFGHTVVVTMPKLELDADIELDYAPAGLRWRLNCPAEKVLDREMVSNLRMEHTI